MAFKRSVCMVVLMPAFAFAACGGDEDGEDDFATQADAVCTESARQVNAVFAEGTPTTQEEAVVADQQLVDVREDELTQLEALDPPEDLAAGYEDFVDARADVARAAEDRLLADESGDQKAVGQSVQASEQAFAAADEAAEAIGLEACAGILPAEEEDEVRAVAEQFFEADTAQELEVNCNELATDAYIEGRGGLKQCEKPGEPITIEIEDAEGVSEVSAEVTFVTDGGPNGGERLVADFVYRDGEWLVDAVSPASPSTATEAPSEEETRKQAYQAYAQAQSEVNDAVDTFNARVQGDLDAGNLAAVMADASKLRTAIFNFDATLREIPFPDSVEEEVNAVLDANGTVIADLDAVAEATSPPEAADLIDRFLKDANSILQPATAELQERLIVG
jgi:hypothetical protein